MPRLPTLKALTNAERQVAAQYYHLALGIATRYVRSLHDQSRADDYYSDAQLALMSAVKNFDPKRGTPLLTFAASCIHSRLRKRCRLDRPRGFRGAPPDTIRSDPKILSLSLVDEPTIEPSPYDPVEDALDAVPESAREIARDRWKFNIRGLELARRYGYASRKSIWTRLDHARRHAVAALGL